MPKLICGAPAPLLFAALLCGTLTGCTDDGTGVPSTLVVSPPSIRITVEDPESAFSLAASPSGGHLEWRVTAHPDWVEVTPLSGTIHGDIAQVVVRGVDLSTLIAGTHRGGVEIISEGGAGAVSVTADISPVVSGSATPSTLEFAPGVDTLRFVVHNTGNRSFAWSAVGVPPSITLKPDRGNLAVGDSTAVIATADRDGLPVGIMEASLRLQTNAPTGDILIPVRIHVPAAPRLSVSPGRLRFPAGDDSESFTVENSGTAELTWSVSSPGSWLVLSPASGALAPGASETVTAAVSRSLLPTPDLESTLTVDSNAQDGPVVLAVSVSSAAGWTGGLTVLDHRVLDAEYSRTVDLLITVSSSPSRLHIIDPQMGTVRSVALSLPPTAVSVSPSGGHAAVGHDGYFTLIDLTRAEEERVYPVSAQVGDLVHGGNGWVYVFPSRDQWESIRSVELSTGSEHNSQRSIHAGTVVRLHPSGDFMYGADRGVSPSDFEKYDIRGGAAALAYDSPYHGDYAFGGDVWISDDGQRLFARAGTVFRSSPIREEDMLYNGSLSGVSFAKWVEHSSSAARVLAFDTPTFQRIPAVEMKVYEPQFLNLLGVVALPTFPTPPGGTPYEAHGQFIFVDSTGQWVYALVRADPASGYLRDWGVLVLTPDDLP